MEAFQTTYYKNKFRGRFLEDWESDGHDLIDMVADYEAQTQDFIYIFRFRISGYARQLYKHLAETNATGSQLLS